MCKGIAFKGDVKDVCAELKKEATRCKGMTVGKYLSLRKLEMKEKEQFAEIIEENKKEKENGRN